MLNCKEIMDIIPHRSPFLLVDRILELVPGIRAIGRKCVTFNEPFLTGHYPGNPVMPGVLIIEALAQVGSVVMLSVDENKGKSPFFGGIDKAKFRNMVTPGDVLTLEVELLKQKGPVGVATAKAYDDEKVFAEAELTFVIR
ncbi:3-hydroxyacyl-ACP dehydratase FabZ [Lachnoclostridium phytofermentans]|uniref:3-hydroxyacyl-ACP dehydratase FabZ n=1 Tax=Lachnoclostridium phytofermentans TaxID=66219 RepID=UPI0004953446|nr:3-hydroxyacyl-ACP dehydratase FabZ [Lachnoclostridium phytofermentans]